MTRTEIGVIIVKHMTRDSLGRRILIEESVLDCVEELEELFNKKLSEEKK